MPFEIDATRARVTAEEDDGEELDENIEFEDGGEEREEAERDDGEESEDTSMM